MPSNWNNRRPRARGDLYFVVNQRPRDRTPLGPRVREDDG